MAYNTPSGMSLIFADATPRYAATRYALRLMPWRFAAAPLRRLRHAPLSPARCFRYARLRYARYVERHDTRDGALHDA